MKITEAFNFQSLFKSTQGFYLILNYSPIFVFIAGTHFLYNILRKPGKRAGRFLWDILPEYTCDNVPALQASLNLVPENKADNSLTALKFNVSKPGGKYREYIGKF